MEITKVRDEKGMMIFIDLEKAFDSIEHNFLMQALKKFNFGDGFLNWIEVIYRNISSCIINNGITSTYFPLTRGVRQGDPLSGYLFIIAIEMLSQKIREIKDIKGITVGNTEIKMIQYVDDMTFVCANAKSARKVFDILKQFERISGLKVNLDKTEGLWLGSQRDSNQRPFNIKWPDGTVKALGVFVSYDDKAAEKANFVIKLEQLSRQLHWWKARALSLVGRILIVKSIAISKLAFLSSVLKVPEWVVKSVNEMIYGFVWNSKQDKVKRSVFIQEYKNGGMNMTDFETVVKAKKINWVKQYFSPNNTADWKICFEYLCGKENLRLFLQSNFDVKELPGSLPEYYKDSIVFWREIKYDSVESKKDLNDQMIWYNSNMNIKNSSVYNKRLFQAGLWHINDLFEAGTLVTYDEWLSRGATPGDFLIWRGIVHALPLRWKQFLMDDVNVGTDINVCQVACANTTLNLCMLTEKDIKRVYIEKAYKKLKPHDFKNKIKYGDLFQGLSKEEWENIYTCPIGIMQDNRIIEMQYKICHRIIGTNKLLYKIGKKPSPNCERCMYPESVEHIFFECHAVRNLWINVLDLWNAYFLENHTALCKSILLGFQMENPENHIALNVLNLYSKHYIYGCKLKQTQPDIKGLLAFLTWHLKINRKYKRLKVHTEYGKLENFISWVMEQ